MIVHVTDFLKNVTWIIWLTVETSCKLWSLITLKVAWLDFLGGYLPSLYINYVGMSKDMGKRLYITTTVLYNDENFLWSGFYCNRSRHGNVMTPLRFLFTFVFLCARSFFSRKCLMEYVPAIIASIMAKFKQILWERFRNILTRSFNNHKNSEIACYPHNSLIF